MSSSHKIQPKSRPFILTFTVIFSIYTLILGVIVYLSLITSFKGLIEFYVKPKFALPETPTIDNYMRAFTAFKVKLSGSLKEIYLPEMLFNSFIYAVGCAFVTVMVKAFVGYVVAKYNFKFNKFIYTTVIISMILPIIGALPSEIQITKFLGLYNTRFGMVVMRASYLGMHFLILYSTFKGLSDEYIEAAEIDGAGQLHILFKIVLPLIKTTLFALFIINFISVWNEYQGPLVYMGNYPTAAVGLYMVIEKPSDSGSRGIPDHMAACMILFMPILILFIAFRNLFMGNLTVGGIKG